MKHDLMAIFDRMDAGVLITDRQGRVLFANATFRKLTGCSPGFGLGKSRIHELQALLDRAMNPAARANSLQDFREQERAHILDALDQTRGKIYGPDGAAALLGLAPTTLVSRLRKYGIPPTRRRLKQQVAFAPVPTLPEPEPEPPMLD